MKSDFIWMDGDLVPYDQATVHIITPTLHYGVGVFEGIRCYQTPTGPAVFRLRDHLTRFLESIHILGVQDFPYTVDDLRQAVHQTIKANGFTECYIRPLMYLQGPMGLNMDQSRPRVGIAAWEWGPYLGREAAEKGAHMMVSSFTRLHPNINMTKSKVVGNYVNSMLVKTLAIRSGYDEAVILDPQGYVAECTDLPGCLSEGETLGDALENINEAIIGCLKARLKSAEERINTASFENRLSISIDLLGNSNVQASTSS